MKFRILADKKGVTLIEAVIASLIMAMGLFVVGTAIYSQFSSLNQNREKAIATLAAQEEIELIRGMSFDSILSLGSSFTASGFDYLPNPSGSLTVDTDTGFSHNSDSNTRRISATVSWDSISGNRLSESLVTVMTRGGINKQ